MASVAAPPPAAHAPASGPKPKKDAEVQQAPRMHTPPPPGKSSGTNAGETKEKKDGDALVNGTHLHPGTPIFATPPMHDPFMSRKASNRLTPGLRDMIRAMGSCTSDPVTPQLGSDCAVLHSQRAADLAAFYVPLQVCGTPALRDLYVDSHFDAPVSNDFDQDRSVEMQALFSACVSSSMDMTGMGNMGLGNMSCISPAFTSHPANASSGVGVDPTFSLLSSPELRNENGTRANSLQPTAVVSVASGGNSTSTVASAVSDAVSPSNENLQLNTNTMPLMPSGVLPTSALSETLTPIMGAAARIAETSSTGRKRQRVPDSSCSKVDQDRKKADERQEPSLIQRSANLQPGQRINASAKVSAAVPIRIASTQARTHPIARARGEIRPGSVRSLSSLIPLPIPVGISAPVEKSANEGGDRTTAGAGIPTEAQKFTRAMVWVNTPHGPSLLPIELVTANGLAHHPLTSYGIMPMFPQPNVTGQQLQQTRKPGAVQAQQIAADMGHGPTAKGIAVAPGTPSSNASNYLESPNTASQVSGEGANGRKRRRRAGVDDTVCSADQARRNRAKAMVRLKQKKAVRSYEKTVRYNVRKRIAMVRPRVNGRFATKREVEEWERNGRRLDGDGNIISK